MFERVVPWKKVDSLIVFIVALLILWMYGPLIIGTTSFYFHVDDLVTAWTLAWDWHALVTDPLHLFDANIFFPESRTLAYSEHFLGVAILAWPIQLLTRQPLLTLRIFQLLTLWVTAIGMYRLLLDWTRDRVAASVGMLLWTFALFRMNHFVHLHIFNTAALPWMIWAFHHYVKTLRHRWLIATAGLFFALSLMSGHYMLFGALMVVVLGAYGLIVFKIRLPAVQWLAIGGSVVVTFGILAFIYVPYTTLPVRSVLENLQFSATVLDFMAFTPALHALGWLPQPPLPEQTVYLGMIPLGLSAWSVVQLIRRRNRPDASLLWSLGYLLLAIVAALFAFGPFVRWSPDHAGIAGPYALLYEWVPGFSGIRVPARLYMIVVFVSSLISAVGISQWRADSRKLFDWKVVVLTMLMVGFLLEGWFHPLNPRYKSLRPLPQPQEIHQWLAEQPDDIAVLHDPFYTKLRVNSEARYTYESIFHWHKQVNGYSGYIPSWMLFLLIRMEHFPDRLSIERLKFLGIDYIILHTEVFDDPRDLELLLRAVEATSGLIIESVVDQRSPDPHYIIRLF
jgi:hypothetical protein